MKPFVAIARYERHVQVYADSTQDTSVFIGELRLAVLEAEQAGVQLPERVLAAIDALISDFANKIKALARSHPVAPYHLAGALRR